MRVSFVFTNPRHHFEMMAPVARELAARGVTVELVSLAEVRGIDSPIAEDLTIRKVIPWNVRRRTTSVAEGMPDGSSRRRLAQRVVWLGVRAALWPWLRNVDLIVVPNDAVYPYLELIAWLRGRGVPYVLMQEGIRFALPKTYDGAPYGGSGAAAVCAWGQGSAEHFIATGVPASVIRVTGAPRFDGIVPEDWKRRADEFRRELGLHAPPLAFISNPIEIQGYGTREYKLDLFAKFLAEAAIEGPLLIKTHAHESPEDFARAAARVPNAPQLVFARDSLFATLAAARAVIVLASTVGLEALMFGLPLAQLEIPGQPFAFEYVERGAAVPIKLGDAAAATRRLLGPNAELAAAGQRLVERHLYDRGRAKLHVADAIIDAIPLRRRRAG
jgi:hypothetical protein